MVGWHRAHVRAVKALVGPLGASQERRCRRGPAGGGARVLGLPAAGAGQQRYREASGRTIPARATTAQAGARKSDVRAKLRPTVKGTEEPFISWADEALDPGPRAATAEQRIARVLECIAYQLFHIRLALSELAAAEEMPERVGKRRRRS
jgi:hypothetical protein